MSWASQWREFLERRYERTHLLHPVGPLLRVEILQQHKRSLALGETLLIRPGDWVGVIHLQNRRFLSGPLASANRAHRVVRELILSLHALAALTASDPSFSQVRAWYGRGCWPQSLMQRLGFSTQEIRAPLERYFLARHFRSVQVHFGAPSVRQDPPIALWMEREALLGKYSRS